MAWIIGLVTKDELRRLHDAGWVDEDPPAELLPEDEKAEDSEVTRAFFVDSDLFTIMTGPDWERAPIKKTQPTAEDDYGYRPTKTG